MSVRVFLVVALLAVVPRLHTAAADPAPDDLSGSPFVPVFIDAKTERAIGPFPYDRAVLARAVERAADAGARGVVIKFFLDRPKSHEGDEALARAMARTKVLLQACVDESETRANPLSARFTLRLDGGGRGPLVGGERGWVPLPLFADAAADVGFVDVRAVDRMPLVERYGGAEVKSLALCCLELATGQKAEVTLGRSVRLGDKALAIDDRGEAEVKYPAADKLEYLSLVDLISADPPPPRQLKDRVVILGYDGDGLRQVETPMGKVRLHQAFVYALESLYGELR